MKSPEEVRSQVVSRLAKSWQLSLSQPDLEWPVAYSLALESSSSMAQRMGEISRWAGGWRQWASDRGVELSYVSRRVSGIEQQLPAKVLVPTVDDAARIAGENWPARIERGRTRLARLQESFPGCNAPALVRSVDGYSDSDFDLLLVAGDWFRTHAFEDVTPRQVPIEGLHAKWLDSHRSDLQWLLGGVELSFARRPQQLNFTYLDPGHRRSGGRLHDSVVPGTPMEPEYRPTIVVISENKDTALFFPEIPGAVAVQGGGDAGVGLVAQVPWLRDAPHLFYWGDIDRDGFRIVNRYRQAGVNIETILMDRETVERYRRWASPTDKNGKSLTHSSLPTLPYLTQEEQGTVILLEAPEEPFAIRIEQERIPLGLAGDLVRRRSSLDS